MLLHRKREQKSGQAKNEREFSAWEAGKKKKKRQQEQKLIDAN